MFPHEFPHSEQEHELAESIYTMYKARKAVGEVQLQVDVLQPQGTGLLQLKLEELRQRLASLEQQLAKETQNLEKTGEQVKAAAGE